MENVKNVTVTEEELENYHWADVTTHLSLIDAKLLYLIANDYVPNFEEEFPEKAETINNYYTIEDLERDDVKVSIEVYKQNGKYIVSTEIKK